LLAPAGTPREIVARLNREMVKVLAMPEVQQKLQFEGGMVSPSTSEEFVAFIRADLARWDRMIKRTGIRVD
jgi:tripartite-type tricarboxylate transporter receptor subunit TctC